MPGPSAAAPGNLRNRVKCLVGIGGGIRIRGSGRGWPLSRPRNPRIPPRFGRENRRGFPERARIGGNIRDFAPIRVPIWPGYMRFREIGESRFGRDRESSLGDASFNRHRLTGIRIGIAGDSGFRFLISSDPFLGQACCRELNTTFKKSPSTTNGQIPSI
jgi:hypothetical protein